MPIDCTFSVPDSVLLPIARKYRQTLLTDPMNWTTSECEAIKAECGPAYAGVPNDNIRNQCERMRKRAKNNLGTICKNAHGAAAIEPQPPQYRFYRSHPAFKARAELEIARANHQCAIFVGCVGPLELWHRTFTHINYDSPGTEPAGDLIVLCKECRKAAQRRVDRMRANAEANAQMSMFKKS